MRNWTSLAATAALCALVALGGCSSDKARQDSGSRSTGGSRSSTSGPYGSGSGTGTDSSGSGGTSAGGGAGSATAPAQKVVFFELDSSDLKPDGQALVGQWAQYLSGNPNAKVRLEGHCDERGTREYNIALGERRANAVQQALTSQGVSAKQISVASFGEERPVALGHDEAAWSQNRRVEIVQ
ncbi:MAG TPA: peptidoglycan-associated lipoprotein Pal [Candidatus Binatia bacterium]|nr:peptidoglycan-associated lipoprotein Pal [Candidatus Binatia bacterium]